MIASGGPRNSPPGTLTRLFFDAVERTTSRTRCRSRSTGTYTPISQPHSRRPGAPDRARPAGARRSRRGDRVAILSENRPEWAIADYACLTAALADVPIYPNLPAGAGCRTSCNDSGAVAIFVLDAAQAAKIAQVRAQVPGAAST